MSDKKGDAWLDEQQNRPRRRKKHKQSKVRTLMLVKMAAGVQ